MSGGVRRISRLSLTVADPVGTAAFYRDALGFEPAGEEHHAGPAFAALVGIPGARAHATILRLGAEEVALVAFAPAGRPYPAERSAADPWFQHFAIVVADMGAAYDRLRAHPGHQPISTGGPQLLPPGTGGVTCYKFRDPEGHPLELSFFPPGVGAARWHAPAAGRVCLGVDHSAIAVADTARAESFYAGPLGMTVAARLVNTGPEQDRLDGLHADGVGITVIGPDDPDSPHLELLDYGTVPRPAMPVPPAANDVAGTRLVLEVADPRALAGRLAAAGAVLVSPVTDRADVLLRDPDGHLLHLVPG